MNIIVHKFGGASVKDAASFLRVVDILSSQYEDNKIVTVVSATGKTTNALEDVLNAYINKTGKAQTLLEDIKLLHVGFLKNLGLTSSEILSDILDVFVEVDWIIEDEVQDPYDYLYDQIVSIGELVSSKILYHLALSKGLNVSWVDVRGAIMTDNNYRAARVDWGITQANILKYVKKELSQNQIVISQGFIGSSSENFTTTLGREGSDFSAAIFSYCLDAKSMTIWKDVKGVLTADPKTFPDATKLDRIDYKEAIEMTYYGAKVIHPKTIKPLQNKNIPLYVKPFMDTTQDGTLISSNGMETYPPVVVIDSDQWLLKISTKDFSFVAEEHLSEIFSTFTQLNIKVSMMRNTAISFTSCVQGFGENIKSLIERLSEKYIVEKEEGIELITIRHDDGKTRQALTLGKTVLFEEILDRTIRLAVK